MQKNKTKSVVTAGVIASLYVVLTMISTAFGLSSGVIQVRVSEALCVLGCFVPSAIPGLAIGCVIANIISGCALWDVIFGSIATLIGALGAYLLRKTKYFVTLPTIISNTLIIPFVLKYVYNCDGVLPYFMLTVGIGEIISAGILGQILFCLLNKNRKTLFSK